MYGQPLDNISPLVVKNHNDETIYGYSYLRYVSLHEKSESHKYFPGNHKCTVSH